ncbi:MAG: HAD superfamily hydrolase (TIGR01509 family) [Gammaproteobacteria bacterium]|jgi:HAD superfamily hydrolase (TIGR01509 family)
MAGFELVIFDCDGVLVDSERIANEVFAKILHEECGLSLSLQDMFDTFVGRSAAQCMEIIEQMYGREPPARLAQRYESEINAALRESVVAVEGVEQALAEIDLPCCVASSGSYAKMRTTLGKANLLERMEGKLFSTSDVTRGKPFADIYLHAASEMGCTDPRRCLVIEDSPVGVSGGVAAGMVVFGFAQLMREQLLIDAGAHRIFKNMENLVGEITAWKPSGAFERSP